MHTRSSDDTAKKDTTTEVADKEDKKAEKKVKAEQKVHDSAKTAYKIFD